MTAYAASGSDSVNGGGILYTEPVKAVLFTHRSHAEKGLSCVKCHSGLFEMEALKVQEKKDFNMESLYSGKYCGACHNGKAAFASDTQCARCHVRIKGMGAQRDIPFYKASEHFGKGKRAVCFNHEIHTKLRKCSSCHPRPFSLRKGSNKITPADHSSNKACFSCHTGKKDAAFYSCNRCHRDQKLAAPHGSLTYIIKDAGPVNFNHTSHSSIVCNQCHDALFYMKKGGTKMNMAEMYEGKSCGTCHDGKRAFQSMKCNRCHRNE
jgi:c(7)-type cytochrome triheme protein